MTTDLERAVSALPATTRNMLARSFLDRASGYVADGDVALADVYGASAAILLGHDLTRAAEALGRRGRHRLARTLTTARDRRMGGPSGWPVLGEVTGEDVSVAEFYQQLAVVLLEVTDAEDAVVQFAVQQLDDTPM